MASGLPRQIHAKEIGYRLPGILQGAAMGLSDLASLGSFVSGLAVLVSLVFLYFQLRQVNAQMHQSERNQQAAIAQARTERQVAVLIAMSDAAQAYVGAIRGGEGLSETEFAQFTLLHRALMVNGENAFLHHETGLITDATFESARLSMKYLATVPAFRAHWPAVRPSCGTRFAAFMDGIIAETPVAVPVDALAAFKANYAAEIGKAQ